MENKKLYHKIENKFNSLALCFNIICIKEKTIYSKEKLSNMMNRSCVLLHFLCFIMVVSFGVVVVVVQADDGWTTENDTFTPYLIQTYHSSIEPLLPNMYNVSGYVVLFTKQNVESMRSGDDDLIVTEHQFTNVNIVDSYLGYAGMLYNIERDLTYTSCTQINNGCSVRVHTGRSCTNTTTQGDPYYNNVVIVGENPWTDARYYTSTNNSDDSGTVSSNFWGKVEIGTVSIEGRVFVVYSLDGTRIGCGVIEKVEENLFTTVTNDLSGSSVDGQVVVYASTRNNLMGQDKVDREGSSVVTCYFGVAESLEANLQSYLYPDPFERGLDCNSTNGCGVQIYSGTSCTDSTTQGGHLYGPDMADPWQYTMYYETDSFGDTYFTGCVETGIFNISSIRGRPFIIHSNNGTRVSCGLLEITSANSNSPPSPTFFSSPTPPTYMKSPSSPTPIDSPLSPTSAKSPSLVKFAGSATSDARTRGKYLVVTAAVSVITYVVVDFGFLF